MDKISRFNESDKTKFLQKLLSIKESGMEVMVPQVYRERMREFTDIEKHYHVTRELIRKPFMPNSVMLGTVLKATAQEAYQKGVPFTNSKSMVIDTSFWVAALSIKRGASCLYSWESLFFRDVLDDYLISLLSLFIEKGDVLNDFENAALKYIPSLQYFKTPIRFYVTDKSGVGEIYGSETLLMDYVRTNHPALFERLFSEPENAYDKVNQINPYMITEQFTDFVQIDTSEECKNVYDPEHPLDSTYDEDYYICWWYPEEVADHLNEAIREIKLDGDDEDEDED
jgi:hypothetical protein